MPLIINGFMNSVPMLLTKRLLTVAGTHIAPGPEFSKTPDRSLRRLRRDLFEEIGQDWCQSDAQDSRAPLRRVWTGALQHLPALGKEVCIVPGFAPI